MNDLIAWFNPAKNIWFVPNFTLFSEEWYIQLGCIPYVEYDDNHIPF